jgi:hypothetical protein
MLKKVTERPERPDGVKYEFNCCAVPDVRETPQGQKVCQACGHDWTEELEFNEDRE